MSDDNTEALERFVTAMRGENRPDPGGRKDDKAKPRLDLLPGRAVLVVGDVLRHGADKYGDDNWRDVAGAKRRYRAAALRHMMADLAGEEIDVESGLRHLAHAACSLLFVLELELQCRDK